MLVDQHFKFTDYISMRFKENIKSNSCLDIFDHRYNTKNTNSLIIKHQSEHPKFHLQIKQNWDLQDLEDCCELSVNKDSNTSTN